MAHGQFAGRQGGPICPIRCGFTLIELLVVISIIALLLSILAPALASARYEAKTVKCGANLHQLGEALAMCQNDYNDFYPMWDDGERLTVSDRIMATWIDVLKQRHIYGMDGGYCPSDNRPDFLNAQRGAAWNFKYPPPQTSEDAVGGADYSYCISVALASGAHKSADTFTHPGGTETTRQMLQRNVSRRVLAGDGFWNWIHNMSGFGLKFDRFDLGGWHANAAGYRHGGPSTFRPSGNFLRQDLHVERATYDVSNYARGLDTGKHFVNYPGEPLNVYPVPIGTQRNPITGQVEAPAEGYPKELDPYHITGPGANRAAWDGEIRMRKGWDQ